MSIYETIQQQAKALGPWLRETRRDFHAHAEGGWCEIRTGSLVARRLTQLGYEVFMGREVCRDASRMGLPTVQRLDAEYQRAMDQGADPEFAPRLRGGFTGVMGVVDCGDGPVVALRFDMDALGVVEAAELSHRPAAEGFRSNNEGVMHACGHDGHTAMGLAVAEVLMNLRDQLHGKIKLLFQPAEEGVRGAKSMVDRGLLDDVDYVIATHMGQRADGVSQVSFTEDGTLATSKLDVTFTGKAAHAAMVPEQGSNALLAAATAVLNLHAIPRNSQGETRINVGTLHAGTGRNVICDRAALELEVRGATTEINDYMERYARRVLEAAAKMHGCSWDVTPMGSSPSLKSHPELVKRAESVCRDKLGLRVLSGVKAGASEDFAYMVNAVHEHGGQGLMFHTLSPCAGPFHGRNFDFDEGDMVAGVTAFCGIVADLLQ